RVDLEPTKSRVQQCQKHRLTNPAKAQAGQRDSYLSRAQKCVEVRQDIVRHLGTSVSALHEHPQLCVPHFDQSKLRRDEETIQEDKHQHKQDLQCQLACDGEHKSGGEKQSLHRLTSPNMTLRTSRKLSTPISCCSRPKTMPRR